MNLATSINLFQRELPDGVVPQDLVPHFVHVQQCYPTEATPEALDKLKESLRLLPTTNYNMLNYLIQHLTRVAKHTEKNKMTSVSLSIVFGPNIFPCGSGLEALKLQGYSNSTTCRMIQNYRTLFDRRRGRKRELPEKPRPYAEHKRQKHVCKHNINYSCMLGIVCIGKLMTYLGYLLMYVSSIHVGSF